MRIQKVEFYSNGSAAKSGILSTSVLMVILQVYDFLDFWHSCISHAPDTLPDSQVKRQCW